MLGAVPACALLSSAQLTSSCCRRPPPPPTPPLLQPPKLFVASPVAGTAAAPPHLLLNALPFMEDCRDYRFASFQKDKWWVGPEGQTAGGPEGMSGR